MGERGWPQSQKSPGPEQAPAGGNVQARVCGLYRWGWGQRPPWRKRRCFKSRPGPAQGKRRGGAGRAALRASGPGLVLLAGSLRCGCRGLDCGRPLSPAGGLCCFPQWKARRKDTCTPAPGSTGDRPGVLPTTRTSIPAAGPLQTRPGFLDEDAAPPGRARPPLRGALLYAQRRALSQCAVPPVIHAWLMLAVGALSP